MKKYKCLNKNIYSKGVYNLVPIRSEDRYRIMQWRNEQIYHLRQVELLNKESQDTYFEEIISKLFDQEQPNQILFSLLKNDQCIAYGGIVNLNWIDKNGEISLVMDTALENSSFHNIWSIYLELIEQVAFKDLNFHKIFTYAYDLRPALYAVLEANNFMLDARLKQHCFFKGKFIDVVMHYKQNPNN